MERIFIGLGSNQLGPTQQIAAALERLRLLPDIQLVSCSSLYLSEPWGYTEQAEFINAVAELHSFMEPPALFAQMQQLEVAAGRGAGERWGPRVLDLDLLAWGERRLDEPDLCIPHPRLAQRRFVLQPWAEIAPDYVVPGMGRVGDLLQACQDECWVKRAEADVQGE